MNLTRIDVRELKELADNYNLLMVEENKKKQEMERLKELQFKNNVNKKANEVLNNISEESYRSA